MTDMIKKQLLDKLSKLGFDGLRVIRTNQQSSDPGEDGVGYGRSGAMARLPETATVLNVLPELLVEFEAQLDHGHLSEIVFEDAWYLDGYDGRKPRYHGLLDSKVSFPRPDRMKVEQGAVDPDADVVLVDDGMHVVALEIPEGRASLLDHSQRASDTGEASTTESASSPAPGMLLQRRDDPWLFELLDEQLAVESTVTLAWATRAFLRYRRPNKSDSPDPGTFMPAESIIRARAALK